MQLAGDYPNNATAAPAAAAVVKAAPAPAQAAAPVPLSSSLATIYQDPTILAFLRSSGLSEQVAANDVARRQTAIQQALGMNVADLGAKGQIERRNIAGGFESRGVLKSGQALQAAAEQEAQQARTQGAMQHNAANSINDLHSNLTQQIAQNQMHAAELGTNSYINQAIAGGRSAIDANTGTTPEDDQ